MQEKVLAIDLGMKKSGFCIYDTDRDIPIQHGYVIATDGDEFVRVLKDLFDIAQRHGVEKIIIELTNKIDTHAVKMRRACHDLAEEHCLHLMTISAAEWRQPLHIYSKRADRDEYKKLAKKYVKDNFPQHFRDYMSDDEAEAICMGKAYALGLKKHTSCKQKRDVVAQTKKNYYKHIEKSEDDESIEYWKLYR